MPDRAAPRLKFTGTVMQCAKWKILISTHKTKLGSAALLARSLAAAATRHARNELWYVVYQMSGVICKFFTFSF
jgi:hypothetical protein